MAPRGGTKEEARDGRRECGCDRFLANSRYSKTEWTPSVPSITMSRCEAGPDTASLLARPLLFSQNALYTTATATAAAAVPAVQGHRPGKCRY